MIVNIGHCATRHQKGGEVTRTPQLSANKAAHSGFETQIRRHQKSKSGVSMTLQKGRMSS